jgi:hypothetical protein
MLLIFVWVQINMHMVLIVFSRVLMLKTTYTLKYACGTGRVYVVYVVYVKTRLILMGCNIFFLGLGWRWVGRLAFSVFSLQNLFSTEKRPARTEGGAGPRPEQFIGPKASHSYESRRNDPSRL